MSCTSRLAQFGRSPHNLIWSKIVSSTYVCWDFCKQMPQIELGIGMRIEEKIRDWGLRFENWRQPLMRVASYTHPFRPKKSSEILTSHLSALYNLCHPGLYIAWLLLICDNKFTSYTYNQKRGIQIVFTFVRGRCRWSRQTGRRNLGILLDLGKKLKKDARHRSPIRYA